jgi:hypothetical protein
LFGLLAQASHSAAIAQAKSKAQHLLSEGSALYEKGGYADALEKFKEAYSTYDSPKLLFNIGQANRDLGRPAEAMEAFEHFLLTARDAAPETIADAENSMVELQKIVGRLRIDCRTESATVSFDGKDLGLAPLHKLLWATPGRHQVTARHWNYLPAVEEVEVRAGKVQTVRIVLRATSPSVDGATAPAPEQPVDKAVLVLNQQKPAESSSGWWMDRTWTWVAAGSAVLFSAGGVAAGLAMKSKFDGLNRTCGSGNSDRPSCSESEISAVATRRNVANVMWGLAAASAATAGILFYFEGRAVTVTPLAGETVGLVGGLRY